MRCFGDGATRRCRPRFVGAGPWSCEAEVGCRRAHPRRPDDGEWECVESSGVIVCRRHGDSAGVVAGPADPAWVCGGEPRICVDFSPDFPPEAARDSGQASRWRCRFVHAPGQPRACERETEVRRVGDACATSDAGAGHRPGPGPACPANTLCVGGACLPTVAPAPGCWTDRDCAGRRCVFGTCEAGA